MSIRSWLEKRRQRADADAIKGAEEDAVESAEERGQHGDRMGQGADNRFAGRIGETPDDINRLGDFNP